MIATNSRSQFWRISNWRIGFKLTFFFLLLVLLSVTLVGLFVTNVSRDALLAQGSVTLQSASRSTAQRIDQAIGEQRDFIRVIGLLPEVVRYTQNPSDPVARDAAQRVLTAAAEKSSAYNSVALVNREGTIILSSVTADVGTDVRFRPYFQEALRGNSYISDPLISDITNKPAIFFSAPVKSDFGVIVAVVRSSLSLNLLWDFVEGDEGTVGPGSFGMLLDENGIRLAHSRSKGNRQTAQDTFLFRAIAPLPPKVEEALVAEKRFGLATQTDVQVLPLPEVAVRLSSSDLTIFETRTDTNSVRNQAAMVKLQNKPWHYLVGAPLTTFTFTADRITLIITISSIVAGALAVIIALLLSRSITRPIVKLSQVADRISLGELDVKVDVNSKDEVGELAEAIRRMQASLQAALERLRARRAA